MYMIYPQDTSTKVVNDVYITLFELDNYCVETGNMV